VSPRLRGRGTPTAADARFMARALELAARGVGRTWPNPPVGAVFVRNGRVVGEGFHAAAGGPHGEVAALLDAGDRARGAELYVTLEPCTVHGRTPPCSDAMVALGLRRAVIATTDPNPRVRGRGVRALRAAGVEVVVGPGHDEAQALIAGFRMRMTAGRPLVTLKLATTLDGRIAARGGDARWITGPDARRLAHRLRDVHDAVLVGAGTVRADDPRLTCRVPGGRDPVRVVLAGPRLDLPPRAQLLRPGGPPTWVVTTTAADPPRSARLARAGVEVITVPGRRGRAAFGDVARALGARGLTTLLVEGGGEVAASALRAGVVDRLVLFVAPTLLGGDARPAIGALDVARVADAVGLRDVTVGRAGRDLVVEARVALRAGKPFASPRRARYRKP